MAELNLEFTKKVRNMSYHRIYFRKSDDNLFSFNCRDLSRHGDFYFDIDFYPIYSMSDLRSQIDLPKRYMFSSGLNNPNGYSHKVNCHKPYYLS